MNEPQIELFLGGDHPWFRPGDVLSCAYRLDLPLGIELKAVEASVLWHTEGQGDEDLAVHFFERTTNENGHLVDPLAVRRFETSLPQSPLSYDGVIVKIRWCVRVRAFLERGKEIVAEAPFRLGNVPASHAAQEHDVS